MKKILFLLIGGCTSVLFAQDIKERIIPLDFKPWGPFIYQSHVPDSCPVEQSKEFVAIEFTGRHADYTSADTWYPSWASNGKMYSPYTDGRGGIWGLGWSGGEKANTGYAEIEGKDPLNLKVTSLGAYPGTPKPYGGRYPCGTLLHDGVWYYGSYCLDNVAGYNWGTMGPFVGFRTSTDYGKTWTDTPHTPESSLFKESAKDGNVVKIGAPHFVDFGKNMEYSPDGKAYLVAHGAVKEDSNPRPANSSWINGDQIYMVRVTPTIENMNDKSKYEYFAGYDSEDEAVWTNEFKKIKPIFEWNNHCGCVTITYNSALKKYIMCITDGWPTLKFMDTYFLESDKPYGPWKMITYMENFGEQAYFVNIPSKFISKDGSKAWLSYSGNFATFSDLGTNPPGGRYAFILQEFRFLTPKQLSKYPYTKNKKGLETRIAKWEENNPLTNPTNLARKATVSVSSVLPGSKKEGVIDGVIDGYPLHLENEWVSNGQKRDAWVRLSWDKKQKISKIWFFDRISPDEHVIKGGIKMSDGTTILVGELPDTGYEGKEISFPTKEVEWIEFKIMGVERGTNIGLSEIAVFE